ncbi:hypothetical protein ABW20_dc0107666 [Dactylellina cionopaga]|nr:hypothetical protein ABW20_dc0107666 [Dactylellina cionopaga]
MTNLSNRHADPASVIGKAATNYISSLPGDLLLVIMSKLRLRDLASFASTNKTIRNLYISQSHQAIATSLRQSLRNQEFPDWFPFPIFHAKDNFADKATNKKTLTAHSTQKMRKMILPGSDSPVDIQAKVKWIEPHLRLLVHANRICKVFNAVSFFTNWFHRIEGHDDNGNHNCITERRNNQMCDETYRVLVFLAQNEIYSAERYVKHCLSDEHIVAQCDISLFDKVELPLPGNWWIRAQVLEAQKALLEGLRDFRKPIQTNNLHIERMVKARRDESFQKRRMAVSKLLVKAINITPARNIEEFERRRFWYDKGIVAGLIFPQIAPLTWCHDSMMAMTWKQDDLEISGFAYLGAASLGYFREATKIVDTLNIKF